MLYCFFTGFNVKLHDVTLNVDSDLIGASPQFTLTCTSIKGPAATVTWTRDSTTVTEGNETVLNNPVTAQYTHTLTVTGRQPGLYKCVVRSNKPSTKSKSFIIQGIPLVVHTWQYHCHSMVSFTVASAPSNLKLVIRNNYTRILLTWTPPSPLGDTTGYRISFTGGSSGSVIVSGGSTDNFTLTRLRSGEMYHISIVGTSEHFFSKSVPWDPVVLTGRI